MELIKETQSNVQYPGRPDKGNYYLPKTTNFKFTAFVDLDFANAQDGKSISEYACLTPGGCVAWTRSAKNQNDIALQTTEAE